MEFISTRRGNSVFDELKDRVYHQKLVEEHIASRHKQSGELEEAMDIIESEFVLNLFKIDDVCELASMSEEVQRKFISQKLFVEGMNISEKAKLQSILTTASILGRVNTRVQDLQDSELYLLAGAMVQMPLEDYGTYGDVLSHPALLKSVLEKTTDLDEQLDICSQVVNYCDNCYHIEGSQVDYQSAIKDALNVVGNYQVKEKGKEK